MAYAQEQRIHIGNFGENYVSSLLSRDAVVRSPGQGEDTGLDLYCEGVKYDAGNTSFRLLNHFWGQVKTTTGGDTGFTCKAKHLRYWLAQPIPVYVFRVLLPAGWLDQPTTPCRVFVYDIFLWATYQGDSDLHDKPQDDDMSLSQDTRWTFELVKEAAGAGQRNPREFVRGHVPFTFGLAAVRKGFFRFNPDVAQDGAGRTLVTTPPRFIPIFISRMFFTCESLAANPSLLSDQPLSDFLIELTRRVADFAKSRGLDRKAMETLLVESDLVQP